MPVEQRFRDIDHYISSFPVDVQKALSSIRQTIREAAPEAQENISYHMPAFSQDGDLVYFSAFKNHIGMYGVGGALVEYKDDVAPYVQLKGTLRFPLDKPMPLELIRKLIIYGLKENLEKLEKSKTG